MDNCQYCSQDTAGNHQPHCPNNPNKPQNPFMGFLDVLGEDRKIDARPFDSLIEKYMGLMSAYMMTMDMIEVVGDIFGEKRLQAVASYVLDELDECIEEIVKLEEQKDGKDSED